MSTIGCTSKSLRDFTSAKAINLFQEFNYLNNYSINVGRSGESIGYLGMGYGVRGMGYRVWGIGYGV